MLVSNRKLVSFFAAVGFAAAALATSPALAVGSYVPSFNNTTTDGYGYVVDVEQDMARTLARQNCEGRGFGGCIGNSETSPFLRDTFSNTCIGIVEGGITGFTAVFSGTGLTRALANKAAMDECLGGAIGRIPGANCSLQIFTTEAAEPDVCDSTCGENEVPMDDENNVAGCQPAGLPSPFDVEINDDCNTADATRPILNFNTGGCRAPYDGDECAIIYPANPIYDSYAATNCRAPTGPDECSGDLPIYDTTGTTPTCRGIESHADCQAENEPVFDGSDPTNPICRAIANAADCAAFDSRPIFDDTGSAPDCRAAATHTECRTADIDTPIRNENGSCRPATNIGGDNECRDAYAHFSTTNQYRAFDGGQCVTPTKDSHCATINSAQGRFDGGQADKCRGFSSFECRNNMNPPRYASGGRCLLPTDNAECVTTYSFDWTETSTATFAPIHNGGSSGTCREVQDSDDCGTFQIPGTNNTYSVYDSVNPAYPSINCRELTREDCYAIGMVRVTRVVSGGEETPHRCEDPDSSNDCRLVDAANPIYDTTTNPGSPFCRPATDNECIATFNPRFGDDNRFQAWEAGSCVTPTTPAHCATINENEPVFDDDVLGDCRAREQKDCSGTTPILDGDGDCRAATGQRDCYTTFPDDMDRRPVRPVFSSDGSCSAVGLGDNSDCTSAYPFNYNGADAKPRPIYDFMELTCREAENITDCGDINSNRPIYDPTQLESDCRQIESTPDCEAQDDERTTGRRLYNGNFGCERIDQGDCDVLMNVYNNVDRCVPPTNSNNCREANSVRPIQQGSICVAATGTACSVAFPTTFPYLDESGNGSCRPAANPGECAGTNDGKTPLLSGGVCVAGADNDACRGVNLQTPILDDKGNADPDDNECRAAIDNLDCRAAYANDPAYFYEADGACQATSPVPLTPEDCFALGFTMVLRAGVCVDSFADGCKVLTGGEMLNIVGISGASECVCASGFEGNAGIGNGCTCPSANPIHDTTNSPNTCRMPNKQSECPSAMPIFDNGCQQIRNSTDCGIVDSTQPIYDDSASHIGVNTYPSLCRVPMTHAECQAIDMTKPVADASDISNPICRAIAEPDDCFALDNRPVFDDSDPSNPICQAATSHTECRTADRDEPILDSTDSSATFCREAKNPATNGDVNECIAAFGPTDNNEYQAYENGRCVTPDEDAHCETINEDEPFFDGTVDGKCRGASSHNDCRLVDAATPIYDTTGAEPICRAAKDPATIGGVNECKDAYSSTSGKRYQAYENGRCVTPMTNMHCETIDLSRPLFNDEVEVGTIPCRAVQLGDCQYRTPPQVVKNNACAFPDSNEDCYLLYYKASLGQDFFPIFDSTKTGNENRCIAPRDSDDCATFLHPDTSGTAPNSYRYNPIYDTQANFSCAPLTDAYCNQDGKVRSDSVRGTLPSGPPFFGNEGELEPRMCIVGVVTDEERDAACAAMTPLTPTYSNIQDACVALPTNPAECAAAHRNRQIYDSASGKCNPVQGNAGATLCNEQHPDTFPAYDSDSNTCVALDSDKNCMSFRGNTFILNPAVTDSTPTDNRCIHRARVAGDDECVVDNLLYDIDDGNCRAPRSEEECSFISHVNRYVNGQCILRNFQASDISCHQNAAPGFPVGTRIHNFNNDVQDCVRINHQIECDVIRSHTNPGNAAGNYHLADNGVCRRRQSSDCSAEGLFFVAAGTGGGGKCRLSQNSNECWMVDDSRPIYEMTEPTNCRPANDASECTPADHPNTLYDADDGSCRLPDEDGECATLYGNAMPIHDPDETDNCRLPNEDSECRGLNGGALPIHDTGATNSCRLPSNSGGNDGNAECFATHGNMMPIFANSEADKCRARTQADCGRRILNTNDGTCRSPRDSNECLGVNMGIRPIASGSVCVAGANNQECRDDNPQKPILDNMGNSDTTDDECRAATGNPDCAAAYPAAPFMASDGSCQAASAATCQANGGQILRNGACAASSECLTSGDEEIINGNECVCRDGFIGSAGGNPGCSCPTTMPVHDTDANPNTCRLPSNSGGNDGNAECAALYPNMPVFDGGEQDRCRARQQNDCATGEILLSGSCEEIMTPQHCMTLHGDAMPLFDGGQADRCRPRIQNDCTGTNQPILRGLVCEVATDRADCYTTFGDAMPRFVTGGTCAAAGNDEQCQAAYPYNFNGANAKPRPIHVGGSCIEVRNIVDCHRVDPANPIHNVVANAMSDCEPVGGDSDCAAVDDAVQSVTNRRAFDDNAACRAVTQADDCDDMGKIYNGTDRCRDPTDSNECRNTIPTRPIEQSGVCDMATSNADCSGAFTTTFPYRNADGSCRPANGNLECLNTNDGRTPLLSGGVCVAGETNQACRAANPQKPILNDMGTGSTTDDECRAAGNNLDCSTAYPAAPFMAGDGSCQAVSAENCQANGGQILRNGACAASSECETTSGGERIINNNECVCATGFIGSAGGNPGCSCPAAMPVHDTDANPNTCRLPSNSGGNDGNAECAALYPNMPRFDGGEQDNCRAYRQSDCTPSLQVVNANNTGCEAPNSHQDCEDINSNLPVHKAGSCLAVADCMASDGEEINPGDRSECQCAANYTGNPGSCECPSLTHTVNNNNQCIPNTAVECLASAGEEVNPANPDECRCLANYAGISPNCVVRTENDCAQTEFFVAAEDGVGGICRDRVADDCAQTEFFVAAEDGGGMCRDRTEDDCDAATEVFVAAESGGGICEAIPTDNTCDAAAGKIPDAEDENACMCAPNYIEEGENCICPTATHIQRANNACELPQNSNECAALNPTLPIYVEEDENNCACPAATHIQRDNICELPKNSDECVAVNPALPLFNENNDKCVVLVVETSPVLPDDGGINVGGGGTEILPYSIREDEVVDFTLTVEVVRGGSGSYVYSKIEENSSPQLIVESTSGVVSFRSEVDSGVYTIFIQVLDNGVSGGNNSVAEIAVVYVTVAAVTFGPPPGVIIVTPRDKVKIVDNKVVGIAAGAVVAVAYWYFSNINNNDVGLLWKPSYALRNDDGNMYYSVGSRWNASADNWRFYWQTSATGGNGAREFTYGSGLKYDDGTFAAALDSHSDSDMTDLDLALSATKTAGAWRLDGGYDLDMQISATETDTQNEFNIGALYTWEQWNIGGLYASERWNLASRYTVANQWNVAARYSLNNWNIAAQYTLDKWILSANATMNGDTATGRIIYSYRFR